MNIDRKFLLEFDAYFDVDVINFSDPPRMLADAISVADMVASWPEASSIRIQLDQILATRTAQNVQAFVQTTNVDWLLDAKTTSLLFQLLTTIRDRLPSDSGGGGV